MRGQDTYDMFAFDYRNVADPILTANDMSFFIHGGLKYNRTGCQLTPPSLDFLEDVGTASQVLVTEEAASCWVN